MVAAMRCSATVVVLEAVPPPLIDPERVGLLTPDDRLDDPKSNSIDDDDEENLEGVKGPSSVHRGEGTTRTRPMIRNCCLAPSIHHASSVVGFARSWVTFGVRMSVVERMRGKVVGTGVPAATATPFPPPPPPGIGPGTFPTPGDTGTSAPPPPPTDPDAAAPGSRNPAGNPTPPGNRSTNPRKTCERTRGWG